MIIINNVSFDQFDTIQVGIVCHISSQMKDFTIFRVSDQADMIVLTNVVFTNNGEHIVLGFEYNIKTGTCVIRCDTAFVGNSPIHNDLTDIIRNRMIPVINQYKGDINAYTIQSAS